MCLKKKKTSTGINRHITQEGKWYEIEINYQGTKPQVGLRWLYGPTAGIVSIQLNIWICIFKPSPKGETSTSIPKTSSPKNSHSLYILVLRNQFWPDFLEAKELFDISQDSDIIILHLRHDENHRGFPMKCQRKTSPESDVKTSIN